MNEHQQEEPIQIELGLIREQTKIKVKKNLFEILSDLNINDEEDLLMISYGTSVPDSVLKLIIVFRYRQSAEKFCSYLKTDDNLERYNFRNLKMNESIFDRERRTSTSSTDSYQLIAEDKMSPSIPINIETSYYDRPLSLMSQSTSTLDTIGNTMKESMMDLESESEIKDHNVEFYSDQSIDDSDLDIILIFLENPRKSGGGDYIDFKLDQTKKLLNIQYKSYMTKKRVLQKRMIKIKTHKKEFNLIANEPLDLKTSELNKSVIILRNIQDQWISDEIVNIYAENLVINDDETNEVDSICPSNFFDKTVYVKYKHEFDFEKLRLRYENRSILNKIPIELIPCYKTRIVLVKIFDPNGNKIPKDYIELYFANKKRCGFESYTSVHEREPFLLLSYESQETCELVGSAKHEGSKYKFIVEPLYNYDLFEKDLNNIKTEVEQKDETIKEEPPKTLETPVIPLYEPKQTAPIENIQPEIKKQDRPFIRLNSEQQPNIKIFKIFDPTLFKEFKAELADRQSNLKITEEDDEIEIVCECTHDLPSNINEYRQVKIKWEQDIGSFVHKYFKQFVSKDITIKYPSETVSKINYNNMKVKLVRKDEKPENSQFEVVGFTDSVNKLIQDIQEKDVPIQPPVVDEIIDDSISGFQLYEIRILFVEMYIRQLKDKYPNMNVVIIPKKLCVNVRGTQSQIEEAKRLAKEITNKIIYKDIPMEPFEAKFFQIKENDVVSWLRDNSIRCTLVPNPEDGYVRIYGIDNERIKNCMNLVKENISINKIDSQLTEGLHEIAIETFIRKHCDDNGVFIDKENGIVQISGFTSNVEELFRIFFVELTS